MKTILVPTEDDDAMSSALETALTLARRCDGYVEGFALRGKLAEFISADMMGGIVVKADHREIIRMETQARAIFESFMQKHGVPRSTTSTDLLSFGWLDNAPEGDAFVGSYGRVFDVRFIESILSASRPNVRFGTKRKSRLARSMSAFAGKADIPPRCPDVCFLPKADIGGSGLLPCNVTLNPIPPVG